MRDIKYETKKRRKEVRKEVWKYGKKRRGVREVQSSKCALVGATSKYRVNEETEEKKEEGKGETRWCEPAPGRIAG